MFAAVTSFFSNLITKDEPRMEMKDIEDAFRKAQKESIANSSSDQTDEIPFLDKDSCFYTTGIISSVKENYVLIDEKYLCEASRVAVQVEVGDKVKYFAYILDQNKEIQIHRIIELCDSSWTDDTEENTKKQETEKEPDPLVKGQMMNRTLVGKVMKRENRLVYIEPHNINFSLDKVRSEFIPLVGDWVQLSSIVEVNENAADLNGAVLEVQSISPLRSKLETGTVTSYNPDTGVGVLNRMTIFTKTVCGAGYIPFVGDKVVSDSIETDQGTFAWRSITLVPLEFKKPKTDLSFSSVEKKDINELGKEEEFGVFVTSNLEFTFEFNEERELTIKIENSGNVRHLLVKCCFLSKKMESQLQLLSPKIDDKICLQPGDEVLYKFNCKARFLGASKEKFLFIFDRFKVVRTFHFQVKAKAIGTQRTSRNGRVQNKIFVQKDVNEEMGYIYGIKPCKPPAFIAVRSGVFKVPQKCWDLVLEGINNRYKRSEQEQIIGDGIPCLMESLNINNYRLKFHNLLYLEEVAQNISMQMYKMESAVFRHCGEYLSLSVPGLAEKRPSLIVGDRVIAVFKWSKSSDTTRFEGFVHKVKSGELLLKFNRQFHSDYSGEVCEVTFKGSVTTLRRCHDAVNLAVNNLGQDFLFPNKVKEQPPQFYITEVEEKDLVKTCPSNHKRNESVSSNCSVTSNLSNEGDVRSPPRVSVLERLFHTKPQNLPSPPNSNGTDTEFVVSKVQSSNINNDTSSDANNAKNIKNNQNKELSDNIEFELKKRKLIWYNKRLNYYQKRAVLNILKGLARPLPYVIFGPPGTGKTITLCEAALQILTTISESRLMIASPSNSSANLIAERLLDSGVLKPGDMVRLIAQHCLEDGTIPEKLVPYCATGTLQEETSGNNMIIEESGFKSNCTASVLGRHRITIGTCSALGIIYNMGLAKGHFTHVLVDEAGQATEPEILIPLTFIQASSGQVILAGDPMQLGPVVQSLSSRNFGLGESFLSRLLHRFPYQRDPEGFETGYDPRLITKLLVNYRSLPEILDLPNSLFYDAELIPQVSSSRSNEAKLLTKLAADLPERTGLPPAIVFHGVNGNNLQHDDSPSWYNPEEATQVYLYISKLYNRGLVADDIGIITPYLAQSRQIRDLLLELEVQAPKVGSVEEFQGQERKVIILSTVRSTSDHINEDIKHTLGFVSSPRRLNVAITRARALLIIIGNPFVLYEDPCWRTVLKYCLDRDSYTGCSISILEAYEQESL